MPRGLSNIKTLLAHSSTSDAQIGVSNDGKIVAIHENGEQFTIDTSTVVASGATYYLDGNSDIAGYELLSRTLPTDDEHIESKSCVGGGANTWGTPVLIDKYVTAALNPGVPTIPAGTWEFHSYAYASKPAVCRLVYEVYFRTSGGDETLLFTAYSALLPDSLSLIEDGYFHSEHTMVDPADRLVVKTYAQSISNSSKTVYIYHSGNTHATHILSPIAAIGVNPLSLQSLDVAGKADFFTAQGGGWKDMIGNPVVPNAGPTIPTWTQIGASPFFGPKFQVNDILWFTYHIQHDYKPGSDIFLHVHWIADGTNANTVKWEFTYTYAKGHNQANYNMTGATVTVEQASPSQYRHMTSEIAAAIANSAFEPDGILLVKIRRITNGATDNTDGIFLLTSDCHYQADTFATKNRTPNFYI